jgi:hypothetical protein
VKLLVLDIEGTLFEATVPLPGTSLRSTIWQAIAVALGEDAAEEEIATHDQWHSGAYSSYMDWMRATIDIHLRHGLTEAVFAGLIDGANRASAAWPFQKIQESQVSRHFAQVERAAARRGRRTRWSRPRSRRAGCGSSGAGCWPVPPTVDLCCGSSGRGRRWRDSRRRRSASTCSTALSRSWSAALEDCEHSCGLPKIRLEIGVILCCETEFWHPTPSGNSSPSSAMRQRS